MQTLEQIDFNSLSLEQLQSLNNEFKTLIEERKKDPKREYPLTTEERETFFAVGFYLHKKENEPDKVSIGDIFHTSWGYDQTNIEFFKVVEISPSGKTCQVIQIGSKTVPGSEGFMSDSVIPDPKTIIVNETCRVKIERSHSQNPITDQYEAVGEIQLRGSVWYAQGLNKHLQSLYRVNGSTCRSWYA